MAATPRGRNEGVKPINKPCLDPHPEYRRPDLTTTSRVLFQARMSQQNRTLCGAAPSTVYKISNYVRRP